MLEIKQGRAGTKHAKGFLYMSTVWPPPTWGQPAESQVDRPGLSAQGVLGAVRDVQETIIRFVSVIDLQRWNKMEQSHWSLGVYSRCTPLGTTKVCNFCSLEGFRPGRLESWAIRNSGLSLMTKAWCLIALGFTLKGKSASNMPSKCAFSGHA